jgi:hypothetical protein
MCNFSALYENCPESQKIINKASDDEKYEYDLNMKGYFNRKQYE